MAKCHENNVSVTDQSPFPKTILEGLIVLRAAHPSHPR